MVLLTPALTRSASYAERGGVTGDLCGSAEFQVRMTFKP
jgi:hypothetical protein